MIEIGAQYLGGPMTPKAFATSVEDAGFDSVWCGDHVGHYVDGIATLGCFAGCTERIRIGTNVLVAPLRPAAITAKALMTVADVAGPDRVVAGFGVGGEFPGEFAAAGADTSTRGRRTDESLEVIRRLWSGRATSFDGEWCRFDGFRLEPVVDPPPEIWVGGRSEAALRRTVRFGRGYLGYLVSPRGLATRVRRLRELSREAGRDRDALAIAANLTFVPGTTAEEALTRVEADGMALGGMTAGHVAKFFLLGDDDVCVARAQEYVDAGMDRLLLGCPPGDDHSLTRFTTAAHRLMPRLRELRPTAALPGAVR